MFKKILLIDDDQVNVRILQTILEQHNFDVQSAFDGAAGIKQLQSDRPDLIILDVEMPVMDGYSFLRELHKMEEFKNIPVIVLTAYEEVQPIFEYKGVNGYLIKPVDHNRLFAKLEECWKIKEQRLA
jgi:CheY-like chemotaxis protein